MSLRSREEYRRTVEGHQSRLVGHPVAEGGTDSHDVAVFDKARAQTLNGAVRVGLAGPYSKGPSFRRTDRDRRPGTRVPFHEPEPDRAEKAEAIRQMILAQEARHAEKFTAARPTTFYRSKTPDTPNPPGPLPVVAPEEAKLKATRGDRVLYFRGPTEAARAMTGCAKPATTKNIQNAAGGITKSAYGWTWERIGDARRGRRGPYAL